MTKVVLPEIGTLSNQSSAREAMNENFDLIEEAFENTLSLDGTTPNAMQADLDLNGFTVLNVADPVADGDAVNKRSVGALVAEYAEEIAEQLIEGTARAETFVATAGQTQFELADTAGTTIATHVFKNGLALLPTVDYSLIDGTMVELTSGAALNDEILVRYTELAPADSILRGDLSNTGSDKGGELVAYKRNATGAANRHLRAKADEFVTPEDFGAIGDGVARTVNDWIVGGALSRGYADLAALQVDFPHVTALTESLDWAAFQQAINYCAETGLPLRASGDYSHNRGLIINSPINLDGGGYFELGSAASPPFISGCRITATAAIATLLLVAPAVSPSAIHGLRINGIYFDANNLASACLQADSCQYSSFTNLKGNRATVIGFDFTDRLGAYFFKNHLNAIHYNSTASVAAQNSVGVRFRDTVAAAGGIVQTHVGWIETFTVDGNGVEIGGADNNEFGAITANTSTGTGIGLVFKGPTGFGFLAPRNNFIRYMAGSVVDETNSRTNTIRNMSSETNSITLSGSGGEVKFRAFNYVTGDYWSTPDFTMKDVKTHPAGALTLQGGTAGTLSSLWGCVDLADAATQGVGISCLMDYDWSTGNIKAITLALAPSTAFAGNFRIRVRGATPANASGTAATSLDESFTITPSATIGFHTKHTLTFATPLPVTYGDTVLLLIERLGTDINDTHTGVLKLLSVGTHFTATGPNSAGGGGGPWDVLDPVI